MGFESADRKGSTFWIELPLAESESEGRQLAETVSNGEKAA